MSGLVTAPLGNGGSMAMNLDTLPSGTSERVNPLDMLEQMDRAVHRQQAMFGVTDPQTGEMIQEPEPSVPADALNARYGIKGPSDGLSLHFTAPLPDSVAAEMNTAKRAEIARANATARSPGGVGSFLSDMGMSFLDPVGLIASALPVVGEARIGAWLGRAGIDLGEGFAARTALRATAGAISGPLANLPVVALRYGLSQQEQADYGMWDAARDVAYGAPLGGILHPLLGAVGDALGVASRSAFAERRGAESPAPEDAQAHGAAIQAAVGAVMADRPADVAPIVQAAPAAAPARTVYAPGVPPIEVRPEVVPAASLIASHDDDGNPNPDYPHAAGLQPRERGAMASLAQVRAIAANLVPERLDLSPEASTGAPIVGPDGVVESGNGRVMALRQVYGDPALADRAASYRAFLQAQGYDTAGIDNPVLVARRMTDLAPEQVRGLARAANERTTLAMNAAERGAVDADRAGAAVPHFRGGMIESAANRPFVRAFMETLSPEERGAMVDKDGALLPEGSRRIRGALLAHAYGDLLGPVLARLLNEDTEGFRGVAGALTDTAGDWARMRQAALRGDIPHGLDITSALGEAVRTLETARRMGRPVNELLTQADLDQPPVSPQAEALLKLFFRDPELRKPVGREKLAEMLTAYATEAQKAVPGADMFGNAPPSAGEILRRVGERAAHAEQAAIAFGARPNVPAADDAALAKLPEGARERLREIYRDAASAKPGFDAELARVADEVGGKLAAPPLKGAPRAVEKIIADYDGKPDRIKDVLRATVVAPTIEDARRAAALIRGRFEIVGKARDLLHDEAATDDGYRDIKINVRVGGIVAEVQVNVPEMLAAKEGAHAFYEMAEAIRRKAGGRPFTEQEQAERDALLAKQKQVYSAAWEASQAATWASHSAISAREETTSARNSSSVIVVPFRSADEYENSRGGSRSQAATDRPLSGESIVTGTPSTSRNLVLGTDGTSASDVSGAAKRVKRKNARTAQVAGTVADMSRDTDTITLRQGEQAGAAAPVRADVVPAATAPAVTPDIEAARAAGMLDTADEADRQAAQEAAEVSASHQEVLAQAAGCIAGGLG